MPVIELLLPEEMDKAISALVSDKEQFILEVLEQKLKEAKIEPIKNDLIEGYKSSYNENTSSLEDYKHVDLEHWDEY